MAAKKKTAKKAAELDAHELRAVAADAKVDPRTVARAIKGAPRQSAVVKAAIAAALRERGHETHAKAVEA